MDLLADDSIKKIVKHRAGWLATVCPLIDFDDAHQFLWLEAVKLVPRFCDSAGTHFTTFLFGHLKFRSLNLIETLSNRARVEGEWAEFYDHQSEDPIEEPLDKLIERIKSALNETDQRVLAQLINPSPKLRRIASRCNSDLQLDRSHHIANTHLALYLNVSEMTISRSIRHLEKVIRRAQSGENVKWKPREL